MIVVTYGVNASGKDTLFKKIAKGSTDVVYVPASQVLMKAAGIISEITPDTSPPREAYKGLEDLSNEARDNLMENDFYRVLEEYSKNFDCVIVPMHLCIAKELTDGQGYIFDEPKIYSWVKNADRVVYIRSPILSIESRIAKDSVNTLRQRIAISYEVLREQMLRTERRWRDDIKGLFENEKVLIVNNHDGGIDRSLGKVLDFLKITNWRNPDKIYERRMS